MWLKLVCELKVSAKMGNPGMNTISTVDLLLDKPPQEQFDRFTRLVSEILKVPIALISIIDLKNNRQFFTSACGLPDPLASDRQSPLSHSFCQHVVYADRPLIVTDARENPLVQDNPAIPDLDVIAYLGMPIYDTLGKTIGSLCAIDHKPRVWSSFEISLMKDLSGAVSDQIELKSSLAAREQSLRKVSRFGNIVENAQHEVFTFDPVTYKFRDVNRGARKNLGYTNAEVRKLTPIDIKPELSLAEFEELIEPLKREELPHLNFETVHLRKNGTTYKVAIRLELHRGGGDETFIAFCQDITRRRAIENALRDKTQDFEALFNNAPGPMTISNMDTEILLANPAYEDVMGAKKGELIGKRFLDFIAPDYITAVREGINNATPDDPFFSITQKEIVRGKPGTMVWTNVVQFENDTPRKIFSIANDVSELHEAKSLAENREIEARKAFEVRKVFLANMSHEIRTPLNAIMGLFQLIQMSDVPDRQKKQAEVGLNASHHLLGQLVNVLEISRMEANAVEISKKPTEIKELAEQWKESAAATNHRLGKSIDIILEIEESAPELWDLDAQRVTQIINNLADNALKFTTEGQVAILIRSNSKGAQDSLQISVSDTGCGIPKSKRDVVFDRFSQVDDAETRENTGSGLGLAISRGLAELELMGATLEVEPNSTKDCYSTTMKLELELED